MSIELDFGTIETIRATALGQMEFARRYTMELLDNTPHELWYQMPQGSPTHLAWQVGHLAYSEYGLMMFRQRGRQPEDLQLVPGTFRKRYGRGTQPDVDTAAQPSVEELLQRLGEIHEQAMAEVRESPLDRFLEEIDMPYAVYPNKLGAFLFCPLHEHIHAGQIGLIRRLLGLEPVR